jgi:hypothetical protein
MQTESISEQMREQHTFDEDWMSRHFMTEFSLKLI